MRSYARDRAKRTEPDTRRAELLEAAIKLARVIGYNHLTRARIAAECGVCEAMVSRYHSPMSSLRASVVREGIKREILEIIAQAIVEGDPQAKRLPAALRDRTLEHLRRICKG